MGALAMAWADRSARDRHCTEAGIRDALWLGLAQACALMPGVSRNGATLTAARRRRFARVDANRLSRHVALPVIGGATGLKALRLTRRGLPDGMAVPFAAGAIASRCSPQKTPARARPRSPSDAPRSGRTASPLATPASGHETSTDRRPRRAETSGRTRPGRRCCGQRRGGRRGSGSPVRLRPPRLTPTPPCGPPPRPGGGAGSVKRFSSEKDDSTQVVVTTGRASSGTPGRRRRAASRADRGRRRSGRRPRASRASGWAGRHERTRHLHRRRRIAERLSVAVGDADTIDVEIEPRWEPHASDIYDCWRESQQSMGIAAYPNGNSLVSLYQIEKQNGFSVILSGLGGDDWVSGSPYAFADMLRELRLGDLARELRVMVDRLPSNVDGRKSAVYMLARFGIAPLLSRRFGRRAHFYFSRLFGVGTNIPAYVDTAFVRRIKLVRKLFAMPIDCACESLVQQQLCANFVLGGVAYGQEITNRVLSQFGMEQRSPFYDRRFIEFCFGMPEEQRCRNGVSKYVLRNSMKDILPVGVLNRQTKGEFTCSYVKALEKVGGESAFRALSIDKVGWIKKDVALKMYQEMSARYSRRDSGYIFLATRLWCVFAVDLWFKACIENQEVSENLRSAM